MNSKLYIITIVFILFIDKSADAAKAKKPKAYNITKQNVKYSNPGFVNDRFKAVIFKPEMLEKVHTTQRPPKSFNKTLYTCKDGVCTNVTFKITEQLGKVENRTRRPAFHPMHMDYCAPYHCNAYHKVACGLNREKMKFQWFQSICHIKRNNVCHTYRGTLKYHAVDTKHCARYVMFWRSRCGSCDDETYQPVCGMSDGRVVLFKNACAMEKANCAVETINDFTEVEMSVCTLFQIYDLEYNKKPPTPSGE